MSQVAEWTEAESPEMAQSGGGLDVVGMLWRQKWVALAITAIALGLGYLYCKKVTPVYKSSAKVLLIKRHADLPVGSERKVNYEDQLATHMTLICSPAVVSRAVAKHQLGALPSLREAEDATRAIISGLQAKPAGDRQVMDPNVMIVSYEGPDARDCQRVLAAVVESYQEYLGDTYQDFSAEVLSLITKAKDELHQQLTAKETEFRTFRQESPLLRAAEGSVNLHAMRMAEIEAQRSQLMVENAQMEARIQAIEKALAEGGSREALALLAASDRTSESGETPSALRSRFEERIFDVLMEEQLWLEQYGPDHPTVRGLRKKVEVMREHLGMLPGQDAGEPVDFLAVYLESLREELKIGRERVARLDGLFEQERSAAKALSTVEVTEETYRSEIARTQQLFDAVVKRLSEMSLASDYGGVTAQVIAEPGLGSLEHPKLPVVLTIAAVLGLMAGYGLGYLRELADRRFRSPEDVHQQLGIPLVGHIPVLPDAQTRRRRSRTAPGDRQLSASLYAYHRPKSRQAEAYRGVRTALLFGTREAGPQAIQVTSPNPGDGKTTLAANLAISLAQSGKRVLLVDADFRRPRVEKLFQVDNPVGLSSVIADGSELVDAIQETPEENLWVIPCGPRPANPSELLTLSRFDELLELAKQKHDYVIVDTPPLLAVTDPSVIAPRVDGVLLVLRLTRSARHDATRAVDMLQSLGAKPLGVVINGVGRKSRYGYGADYKYTGYGYGGYRYGYGRYGYASAAHGYGYGYGYGAEAHEGNGRDSYYTDEEAAPAELER